MPRRATHRKLQQQVSHRRQETGNRSTSDAAQQQHTGRSTSATANQQYVSSSKPAKDAADSMEGMMA